MRKSKPISDDEFRKKAVKISKYVDFKGCQTADEINNLILAKHSKRLNALGRGGFSERLIMDAYLAPHEDYMRILGGTDEEYEGVKSDY